MSDNLPAISLDAIQDKIFTLRNTQVIIDRDLAELYDVSTKVLNQAVKRNLGRFPEAFRFQLTANEKAELVTNCDRFNLRSQTVTSSGHGGRRYLPYAFSEQGVAMLSAILRSETAVQVSIRIMEAFVAMRKFIATNGAIFQRLARVERKQLESDEKFERIFKAIESKELQPKQGIFFDGQIFDAYTFVADLIRSAGKSIVLIDNYIDDTVLTLFAKRKKGVLLTIVTQTVSKRLLLDIKKLNKQYPPATVKKFGKSHDRFLIIDDSRIYHFGASLKDLGKKWFAFSKMDIGAVEMLGKLESLAEVKGDG